LPFVHLSWLLNNIITSAVYRAQQYCFSLLDLIRYSQKPGDDLSTFHTSGRSSSIKELAELR